MYGKKRMIMLALVLLAGSVVCAVSGSLPVLIAGGTCRASRPR